MTRPRLLDLFCGAGGATRGYQQAGFHVTGVDLVASPNYCGDDFHQADAMTFPLDGYDAIHASPPCQAFTTIGKMTRQGKRIRTDLIAPTRRRLIGSGVPWVMENVQGAPLVNPLRLCGQWFGLDVRRHRLFESSLLFLAPDCRAMHRPEPVAVYGDHPEQAARTNRGGGYINRAHTLEAGQRAMGIDWMTWPELTQAIPPAYCQWIGERLLEAMEAAA